MIRPTARFLRNLAAAALLLAPVLVHAQAAPFETRAGSAYVIDLATDTVLLAKNAEEPLPPASMSKLMTLNMLFEALEDGRVDLDTQFAVSGRAAAMGGSTMFLDERDRPTVEQLIRGIVVLSGNDASVVVAEGLAGSEEAFARSMTDRAHELGMTQTNLANASGWPHPAHRMSMRDLAIVARRLIEEFPDFYTYFAETEYRFDGRAPENRFNRNPLLSLGLGADGLKTGHTTEAGYGLAGSAVQGDRRIVFVISGLDSQTARLEESERIINWAFRQFVKRQVVSAGTELAEVPVFMGMADRVPLAAARDAELLLPARAEDAMTAEAVFDSPVTAPVTAGQQLGELVIRVPEMPDHRVPLVAAADVAAGGFGVRLRSAAEHLLARALAEVPGL